MSRQPSWISRWVTAGAHTRKGFYHVPWPRKHRGNSWNYIFICYNLGDVDKYKFMCRPSWHSIWRPSQRHLVGPMGFLDLWNGGLATNRIFLPVLVFGFIAENRSKMAAILNFKIAATMGVRISCWVYFFQLPLGGSTPAQSFMLASKTERLWWICGICRSTIAVNYRYGCSI